MSQKFSIEDAGDSCGSASAGKHIIVYSDENNNNAVDTGEMIEEFWICNGASALIDIELASATDCVNGGIWVITGNDIDRDGEIDVIEEKSELVCNGQDGADGDHGHNAITDVVAATPIACPSGGWTINAYVDENNNDTPDPVELVWSRSVCNGFDSLIDLDPADPICTNGGVKIKSGKDTNGNNILEDEEVTSFSNACNGVDGLNGQDAPDSYFDVITLPAGSFGCPAGCIQIIHWVDYNGNGLLDSGLTPDEFKWTRTVTNGLGLNVYFEAPDPICTNGGSKLVIWKDLDGDNVPDTGETEMTNICNGLNGINGTDGTDAPFVYVEMEPELPGVNCTAGGVRIYAWADNNFNGTEDSGESYPNSYTCNGDNGTNGLDGANGYNFLFQVFVADPILCPTGGYNLRGGLDNNPDNGMLDALEVTISFTVCNGLQGLSGADGADGTDGADGADAPIPYIIVTDELPGLNCSTGGQQVHTWEDVNRNGVEEAGEHLSTDYVCNGFNGVNGTDGTDGTDGAKGHDALIRFAVIDPVCLNGGYKIEIGNDIDDDGIFEDGEIVGSENICNGLNGADGADGANGTNAPIPHFNNEGSLPSNCPNGGRTITYWLDNNFDGGFDPAEYVWTAHLCNGLNPMILLSDAGGTCANSGTRIDTGTDSNGNDILDAGEISQTRYVCNGLNGTNGTDGTNGSNGLTSFINVTNEASGSNCQYGGQKVDTGLDINGNGIFDSVEISNTKYVCNGAPGADGTDGTDGTSTAIRIVDEPTGANCANGGKKIESGPDANQDGLPDSVTSTVYSCSKRVVYTPEGPSTATCSSFNFETGANADHCVLYDAGGNPQNFAGAASTIFVSVGWCSAQCFDAASTQVTIPVCTGVVGFYHTDVMTCAWDGL